MIIIECTKKPYEEEHLVKLKSLRLRCQPKEAKKLHTHYQKCCDQLRQYWSMRCHDRGLMLQSFMESKLRFRPIKVKGQYQVASRRFQRHKSQVADYGRYYTHEQIFGMMEDKLWTTRDTNQLADYTDAMRLRFNAYLDWVKEWDEKYNEGACVDAIDNLKVEIKKPENIQIEL